MDAAAGRTLPSHTILCSRTGWASAGAGGGASTDQTDSEQRMFEMPYVHDHTNPPHLGLTAPDGGLPGAAGPLHGARINSQGVPSIATWIHLR